MSGSDVLLIIAQIMARENLLSPRSMATLCLVSTDMHAAVQWRVRRSRRIYDKYLPQFARRLQSRLIGGIDYVAEHTHVVAAQDIYMSALGIYMRDSINVQYEAADNWMLSGISFIAYKPVDFVAVLILCGEVINICAYSRADYTPMHNGRYFIDLGLALHINPIPLSGAHLLIPSATDFGPEFNTEVNMFGRVFDKVIIRVRRPAPDTAIEYGAAVGEMRHMYKRSIVTRAGHARGVSQPADICEHFMQLYGDTLPDVYDSI